MRRILLGAATALAIVGTWSGLSAVAADGSSDIPAAFKPFEHLIGAWKGAGIPEANKIRGWPEKQNWAWTFENGTPSGMSVEMDKDKTLAKAKLTYDPKTKQYHLDGTDPEGKPVSFVGTLAKDGQTLELDRVNDLPGGVKQKLSLRLNSNMIRYTVWDDRQEPGAPRFSRFIEVNQGKVGESFAAGGGASNLPKCILTGGTATMSVSFQGKSYPICCTGCRDEFEADPEKYVKKAALMAASEKKEAKPGASRVGKDDGSFDSLLIGDGPSPSAKTKAMPKKGNSSRPARGPADAKDAPPEDEKPEAGASSASTSTDDKAARLLSQAQNFEKRGKGPAAVIFYRMIVKDHAGTPQAKTAAVRLKALGAK